MYDQLDLLDEFSNKVYTLVGWDNGHSSPDITQWGRMRAYADGSLRKQMAEGDIDLDYNDEPLREELQAITYKFNSRGAIEITSKDDIKPGLGGRSPDRLDAVIMAATDMSPWTGNPYNRMPVGTVISEDRRDVAPIDDFQSRISGAGMPMYW